MSFFDASRNLRLKIANLEVLIGQYVQRLGMWVSELGQDIIRDGAIRRRDNQEIPKP